MAPNAQYNYQPLDESKLEIRLLRLISSLPAENEAEQILRFELSTASLNQPPDFTALSYCWTEEHATCPIMLHGCKFYVRPNLFKYLQTLGHERHTGLLFVDAICIDQSNIAERNAQVRLMGDVYRLATNVVAWLGDDFDFLCEHLSSLIDDFQRSYDAGSRSKDVRDLALLIVGTLGGSPYWTRMWVMQEIVLAQSLTIQCGLARLEGRVLQQMSMLLDIRDSDVTSFPMQFRTGWAEPSGEPVGEMLRFDVMRQVLGLRKNRDFHQGDKIPLAQAVRLFSRRRCSDRHDKVFAVLGLVTDVIQPDYRTALPELYIRTLAVSDAEVKCLKSGGYAIKERLLDHGNEAGSMALILAKALDWSCLHPLTALVIRQTTTDLSLFRSIMYRIAAVGQSRSRIKFKVLQAWVRLIPQKFRRSLEHAVAVIVYRAMQLRLKVAKIRNERMKMPDGSGEVRTYREWVELIEDIEAETWREMETSEYQARLARAFPKRDTGAHERESSSLSLQEQT